MGSLGELFQWVADRRAARREFADENLIDPLAQADLNQALKQNPHLTPEEQVIILNQARVKHRRVQEAIDDNLFD